MGFLDQWIRVYRRNPISRPKLIPKSLRLKVAEASAPRTSLLVIGFFLHEKLVSCLF